MNLFKVTSLGYFIIAREKELTLFMSLSLSDMGKSGQSHLGCCGGQRSRDWDQVKGCCVYS